MSKRNKRRKSSSSNPYQPPAETPRRDSPAGLAYESRRGEVATVAWMLTALLTSLTETIGLCAKLYFASAPNVDESLAPLAMLPGITLFIGLISGLICLILTPLVYRWRRTSPPALVTLFAVFVSLLPFGGLVLRSVVVNW